MKWQIAFLLAAVLSLGVAGAATAQTLTSDKPDYAPGETATFTGAGFAPGEEVSVVVSHADAVPDTGADHEHWTVTADETGSFETTWHVCEDDCIGATLAATAIGMTSGLTASVTFTDSPRIGSVSVSAQSGAVTYGAGGSVSYTVTVNRGSGGGSAGAFSATMSITSALPAGASASFSPNPIAFVPADGSKTTTLTITTAGSTPAGAVSFTARGATGAAGADNASGAGSLNVTPAPLSVTANNFAKTFDAVPYSGGNGVSFSGFVLSQNSSALGGALTFSGTSQGAVNFGNYVITPGGYTSTNYAIAFVSGSLAVGKANATVTVSGFSGTYDASAHGASGSAAGVAADPSAAGSTLSLGASFTDAPGGTANWSFTGGTNYNNQSGTAAIAIGKADAVVTVNGYSGTYDASAHGASGSAVGVAADPSASGSTLSLGASFSDAPGGTASWSFTGGTNYNNQSGTAAIAIGKADAVVTVNGYSGTFDASAHGASGSAVGVAADPSAAGSTLSFGASFTDAPGGTASWSFTGGTNYNDQSGTAAIAIGKADAVVTVNGYSGTYDAAAHGASGSAVGVAADPSAAGSTLSLGASFTDAPGGTANWSFTGGTNYNNQSGTAAIAIGKADAVVTVNGYSGTYDASAHGASGSAVGVAADPSASGSTLSLGASFTDAPGGTANWSFTGGTNYNNQSGTAAIAIGKADAVVTVNGYSGTYDASAHGASGSAAGVAADPSAAGSTLSLGASFTDAPGGTASWSFTGGTNYNDQSGTAAIAIGKADAVVTVNGYSGTFDAAAHSASGSAVGVAADPSATGSTLSFGASFTDAPGGTASWSFTGGTNYNNQSGTAAIAIGKADAVVTVNGYSGTYDASAHGASGSAIGVAADPSASGSTLSLGASFTDAPGGTASWSFTGGTNYNNQSGTAAIAIVKADAVVTVNGYSGTFDASAHGASGSAVGVAADPSAAGSTLSFGASFSDAPGGTASWSFTGGTNYNNQSGTAAIAIGKADAVVTVNGYSGTFDASAHGASGSAVGVAADPSAAGSTLSFGASFTDAPGGTASWSFTGGTNYNDQSGTAAIAIGKADAVVTVNGYSGTYDASAHGASGSAVGVAADPSASGSTLSLGASFTDAPGGTANWSFTGGTNYNDQSGNAAIAIGKADATVAITPYSGTYDAAAHNLSGTVTGVAGDATAVGSSLTFGASYANVPGGTGTWSFSGGTNYNDDSGTAAISIGKADAVVTVNGYSGTFDAAAHAATGSAAGVVGDPTAAGSSLSLGASFTNAPGGTANWSFTGGTNYNNQSGTAAIVIGKADAIVTVNGYSGTFDAAAHGATGSAAGVVGDASAAGSSLSLGASFTDAPGGTANWSFTGGTNYNNQSGTAAIVIGKADAIVTVNGYSGTFDAAAHGATGSAAGVVGDASAAGSSLSLGASFTDAPGGTANWSFTGGTNYNNQTGTAAIVIGKANAVVTVNGYSGTFDAAAHGATGSAAGVVGDASAAGSSLSLGASFTSAPGGTANWSFTGGTNYNNQTGTAAIVIGKANAVVTVNGYSGMYDAAAHGATGSAAGVVGDASAAGSSLSLGASFTNAPGGTASWAFNGGTNYNNQSGTAAIVINKANATVSVAGFSGAFDGLPHGATGTVLGVPGDPTATGGVLNLGASFTFVPGGTASWSFTGGTNYNNQTGSVAISIGVASTTSTVAASPASQQYTDKVTLTATLSPASLAGIPAATDVTFYVGTQFVGGPVALNAAGVGVLTNVALVEPIPFGTAPTGQMSPGSHVVKAVFGGKNPNFAITDPTSTLTITPEDARATYSGAAFASTSGANSSSATVTLSATIQDITASADAAGDLSFGDIRNARVTFIDRDNNTVIAANLPIGLVSAADTKTGTATFNWNVNIGAANSNSYTVGVIVTNYYTRNNSLDDAVVTVSKPLAEFVTGGGYMTLTSSSGLFAGAVGSRNNFGFNIKYNKQNTNLQGNINTIIRNAGRTYQVKGNSMTSLSAAPTAAGGTAVFNGKANIQDITNPLAPIAVDGNASLQVTMTDSGEPGNTDQIAITVWNKNGGLWFASNWDGVKTVQQVLAGGNLQVRGAAGGKAIAVGGTVAATTPEAAEAVKLPTVFAMPQNFPNPFAGATSIQYDLPRASHVQLAVFDVNGRQVASLVDGDVEAGHHVIQWASRRGSGSVSEAGVYFLRMVARPSEGGDGFKMVRRMIVVR